MATWDEITKNAYDKGIILDGCGQDKRYYTFGKYEDFCGFDVLKEKCACGYDIDWGSGGGSTGSGTSDVTYELYAGELDYSAYTTADMIDSESVLKLTKYTETKSSLQGGIDYEFNLTPNGIAGLNSRVTDEELDAYSKQYAKDFVVAIPKSAGTLTFATIGDDTENWSTKELTINSVIYSVYSRISYTEQVNLYDTEVESPKNTPIDYTIRLQ